MGSAATDTREISTRFDLSTVSRAYDTANTSSLCRSTIETTGDTTTLLSKIGKTMPIPCGHIGGDAYTVFVDAIADEQDTFRWYSTLTKCDTDGVVTVVQGYAEGICLPVISAGQTGGVDTIILYGQAYSIETDGIGYYYSIGGTKSHDVVNWVTHGVPLVPLGLYATGPSIYVVGPTGCFRVEDETTVVDVNMHPYNVFQHLNHVHVTPEGVHRLCQVQWSPPATWQMGSNGTKFRFSYAVLRGTEIQIKFNPDPYYADSKQVFEIGDVFVELTAGKPPVYYDITDIYSKDGIDDSIFLLAENDRAWPQNVEWHTNGYSRQLARGAVVLCSMDLSAPDTTVLVQGLELEIPGDTRNWASDGRGQLVWQTMEDPDKLQWSNGDSPLRVYACPDGGTEVIALTLQGTTESFVQIVYRSKSTPYTSSIKYAWSSGSAIATSRYILPADAIAVSRPDDVVVASVPLPPSDGKNVVYISTLGRVPPVFVAGCVPTVKSIGDALDTDETYEIQWVPNDDENRVAILRTTRTLAPSDAVPIDIEEPVTADSIQEEYSSLANSPMFFVGRSTLCGLFSGEDANPLSGPAYTLREYLPYSTSYYEIWKNSGISDTAGSVDRMVTHVRNFNAKYGTTAADPYDRSLCLDTERMMAEVFPTGANVQSLEPSAICFHEACSKAKDRKHMVGAYLRSVACDINYTICIPSLAAGDITGSAVVIYNNCGNTGSGGGGEGVGGILPVVVSSGGFPLWATILLTVVGVLVVLLLAVYLYRRRGRAKAPPPPAVPDVLNGEK